MKFEQLGLHTEVLKGVSNAGFTDCTIVQEKVCPVSLTGRDVMVRSKTGSGKTAVFILTILENLVRAREAGRQYRAMVVSPTRELALQIAGDAQVLASGIPDVRIGCFYGGVGYDKQRTDMKSGVDIYVGTPGRLIDFMRSREIDFSKIDSFTVDEADRMFDMGFYPDIQKIFSALPDRTKRQTMLFSATLSVKVRNLAWNFMNNPEEIELEPDQVTVDGIVQELYHTPKSEKFKLLLMLLREENPASVLIFTDTKYMAVEVSERLKLNGFDVSCLMGDMPQTQRQKALQKMKEGRIWGLVATDVAARGLQIDDLPLVVNYDIPEDYENYVHRIGRTARAGKKGKAITLADEEHVWGLEAIENFIHMKIPVVWKDNVAEVTDHSEGIRIRNREHLAGVTHPVHGSQRGRSSSSRRPAQSQRGPGVQRSPASKAPQKKAAPQRKGEDDRLSRMSESERMAYYKKAFMDEPSPKKKAASAPAKRARAASAHVAPAAAPAAVVPAASEGKPQKGLKGLLGKLFGKKK